jgi:hypothetical protein
VGRERASRHSSSCRQVSLSALPHSMYAMSACLQPPGIPWTALQLTPALQLVQALTRLVDIRLAYYKGR